MSNKKLVNINIKTSSPVIYTNIPYRKATDNKNYIDGIHRELYSILSNEMIDLVSSTLGNTSKATSVIYDGSDYSASFVEDVDTLGAGIAANVNGALADEILERAIFYCPEDTGQLKKSGRVVWDRGICYVIFDASYAWFVHEFTWRTIKTDKNPNATHKWLEIAYQEVMKEHGLL